jgi:hypothetical protein
MVATLEAQPIIKVVKMKPQMTLNIQITQKKLSPGMSNMTRLPV